MYFGAGDDADLCSELLQESLDALRALPEATLFDEGTVSSVWLEVVERATKFLRFVFPDELLNTCVRNVIIQQTDELKMLNIYNL